jgi:hypothetical protein
MYRLAISREGEIVLRRTLITLFGLLLVVPVITAATPGPPSFSLPEQASEVAPGVFFLGYAVEDGVDVVGYAYARYATADEVGRRGNAKPDSPGGGGGNGGGKPGGGDGGSQDPATCYSYIANGTRWSTTETYLFNPNSPSGNIAGVTLPDVNGAFAAWESAGAANIVDQAGSDTTIGELVADTAGTDGENEIYFASITKERVLGYTIVWSTRSRGPLLGRIVEADMVIDDDDWDWYTESSAAGRNQIDFWSVFTHEAGHWVGMGHTDTETWCEAQTMYPSIRSGDSTKRVLGDGDTAGVFSLYH